MKFLSVDIETTGLDEKVHSIIQFAAVHADDKATFKPQIFHGWVKPDGMVWDIYCLNLHFNWIKQVLERLREGTTHHMSDHQPEIFEDFEQLHSAFYVWLAQQRIYNEDDHLKGKKLLALGKNFGSFDHRFLTAAGYGNLWRHRSLDATPYYTIATDEKPPELKVCKQRAFERGCVFNSKEVAHTALEDAIDVMTLQQFYHAAPWIPQ